MNGQGVPQLPERVSTWPHLVTREAAVGLLVCAAVAFFSLACPLGLLPPADPGAGGFTAKAPWFFVGLQEMLYHLPPWLAAGILTPLAVLSLIFFPYYTTMQGKAMSAPASRYFLAAVFTAVAALLILASPIPFYSQAALSGLFAIAVAVPSLSGAKVQKLAPGELLLAYLLVSYMMWTVIGQWLRTSDWQWVWQV